MNNYLKVFTLLLLIHVHVNAQLPGPKKMLTHADTLRGSYGPGRDWWDASKYDLHVRFNIKDSSISGYNIISLTAIKKGSVMQIDLQQPMQIDSIRFDNNAAAIQGNEITKDGNAYFISVKNNEAAKQLTIFYHGKPTVAVRPPWDGGLIWQKDKHNNPWVSIACQGMGASVWYPCKDHQADEPDSAAMHITVPDSLVCVGNGRLRGITGNSDGTATYYWAVTNPINSYNIIPYIGKYVHYTEMYEGEKGKLDMDYWVLEYNLEKTKIHFADAPRMMKAFEYWFGPYPFYEDGYKLVDAPHLGMEHQSATAYGNQYKKGYLGMDLSGSGWGLEWDYIIVHESGHEWFANNISTKDIADMWVHEGFTCYSEVLFTEYFYGKKAATEYVTGIRKGIENKATIIGTYNVNREGSTDMYPKGANLIHTIRQIINDDSLFRKILRGLNKSFYHQTVTSRQVEEYISAESKINFSKIFDQYLRNTQIPVLEYRIKKNALYYRFSNCIKDFTMPVKINAGGEQWIQATQKMQRLTLPSSAASNFYADPNFYINTKKVD